MSTPITTVEDFIAAIHQTEGNQDMVAGTFGPSGFKGQKVQAPVPLSDTEMQIRHAIERHALTGKPDFPSLKTWSIKQPWAWAILHAGKDRENRPRKTGLGFGWHYIHASAGKNNKREGEERGFILEQLDGGAAYDSLTWPKIYAAPRGAIVGAFLLAGWTDEDEGSPWFFGPYALRILKTIPFPTPIPAKGQLGPWTFPRP